jgi:hypothetical protein
MKTKNTKRMAWLLGSLAIMPFTAQAFDAGSDGSYGAISFSNNSPIPLTNTLVMPADGIFRCTAITIGTNCHVNFTPNALNTPVYLLAQSDIVINGIIDVSGSDGQTNGSYSLAGPGGFSGGNAGQNGLAPGYGQGPGSGHTAPSQWGYSGSFGSLGQSGSTNYGNLLLVPLVGGSGGGGSFYSSSTIPGASGGAGGGAILLASSTSVNIAGSIVARGGRSVVISGGSYFSGGGSGGGVRIVAPTVSVVGFIDVSGGTNSYNGGYVGYGGNGRVRIDTISTANATVIGYFRSGSPVVSYGRSLLVFPPAAPQLYFTSVAGTAIQAGTNNSVLVPSGGSTNQIVTLCGTNFLGTVPVQIVATPANGPAFTTNIMLNFPTTNLLVSTNVVIQVPAGVTTQLNAYANYGVQP